jgi:Beta-1,3-glucanase
VTPYSGFKSEIDKPGIRDKVYQAMKQAPPYWRKLAVDASRVLSPYKGMEIGIFPALILNNYISRVWEFYGPREMKATGEGNVPFVGSVKGGKLVFSSSETKEVITFAKPTAKQVYTSGPVSEQVPESANGRRIRAYLQAAFMRSTLLVDDFDLWACDSSQFYKYNPINHYAKILHEAAAGDGAYAFESDDACSKSNAISVRSPEFIYINLCKIGDR